MSESPAASNGSSSDEPFSTGILTGSEVLEWRCTLCERAWDESCGKKSGTPDGRLLICNLKKHGTSDQQKKNEAELAGTPAGDLLLSGATFPPAGLIKGVLERFQGGAAPSESGYVVDGVHVNKQKVWQILFVVAEAHKRIEQEALAGATALMIMRDERHARLHFRFRHCNDDLEAPSQKKKKTQKIKKNFHNKQKY